jgi:hypothetical protein
MPIMRGKSLDWISTHTEILGGFAFEVDTEGPAGWTHKAERISFEYWNTSTRTLIVVEGWVAKTKKGWWRTNAHCTISKSRYLENSSPLDDETIFELEILRRENRSSKYGHKGTYMEARKILRKFLADHVLEMVELTA